MRETRNAQASVFDFYCEHELGKQLNTLSDLLDEHPAILLLVADDFDKKDAARTGACGLSLGKLTRA